MGTFMDAMAFRHACKKFDNTRAIASETFETILESVRLSPSSFGMEPWRLFVIRSKGLRETLKPLCWNQPQITECSELIVFTTDNEAVGSDEAYIRRMFARRGLDIEATEQYVARYRGYVDALKAQNRLEDWAAKQCYIAAANMMTCAASLGIDSCPIEGFERAKLEELFEFEGERSVALIVALGYRAQKQSERKRLEMAQIITYM